MNQKLNMAFPSPAEKDISKIIKLYNNALIAIFNSQASREKRLMAIENRGSGTGKFSGEKYIGKHFKFIEYTNPLSLSLYYSEDGLNWPEDNEIFNYAPPD